MGNWFSENKKQAPALVHSNLKGDSADPDLVYKVELQASKEPLNLPKIPQVECDFNAMECGMVSWKSRAPDIILYRKVDLKNCVQQASINRLNKESVKRVEKNHNLLVNLLRVTKNPIKNVGGKSYMINKLKPSSKKYRSIKQHFNSTNKTCFNIDKIEEIVNPYLLVQYELRKEQYLEINVKQIERKLFHGTKKSNVHAICKYNFDWRKVEAHKFGKGVSFTPMSNYATYYGDIHENQKLMFLVNVLVAKDQMGGRKTIIPKDKYDTTTNQDKTVYVKYDDNTFYPSYIIYYSGYDPNQGEPHSSNQLADYIMQKIPK